MCNIGLPPIKPTLTSQIHALQKEFVQLKDDVYESVKSQPVDIFKIKLASVDVDTRRHHEIVMREIIGNKETVDDVWNDLNFYMNYLNYQLLQHILNKFEDTALQGQMMQYIARIIVFFKNTRICDFMECWHGITPPKGKLQDFTVKWHKDWDTCTLQELDQLKCQLARELHLPMFALLLQGVHEHSTTAPILFSVPSSIVPQLQADIRSIELKVLKDLDVETMAVDSVVCRVNIPLQIEVLQKEFITLRDDVYEVKIQHQKIGPFKVMLNSLDVNLLHRHNKALQAIVGNKETVDDIWRDLSLYINFLHYELLKNVVEKYKDPDLKKRMRQYIENVTTFFSETKVCDFMQFWPVQFETPPREELCNFVIKCNKDWNTCTLQDIAQLKCILARKLLLPEHAILLQDLLKSSLTIIFSVNVSIVPQLKSNIKKTELSVFVEMDIETITVDGVVCYEAPLLQYTTHLKQLYTSRSPIQPLSDPKHKHLFNFHLARIEKQVLSQGDMDRFTRESLRGDMDDVVYKKTAMEMSELGGKAHGSQPKVVLIEGAPGVGKTTFAWQLCWQWAEGKLLQDYSIVLLLPLRDNNIRHITSLSDLFRHSNGQVRDEVSRRVVKSNGSGCLIWLEAWDELVEDLRTDSLFTQLIWGHQLPAATIYITSRPWATESLLEQIGDRISQHTELLTRPYEEVEDQIREIAISMNEETAEVSEFDFVTYLKFNPVIRTAMYTPVTASIVQQMFKCAPHKPPTTVTQLYSAYVLMRLEHYLTQHPKYSDKDTKVRTLDDLPEGVLAEFRRLCTLAYEGVSQQMIVFSSLPEGVSNLGLLQDVPPLYGEAEDKVSYNFLHYTVQEYLAALHLSRLSPPEQMKAIDTKFLNTKYGSSHCKTTQFKMVFLFLAGITKLVSYPEIFLSKLLRRNTVSMYNWLYESQNNHLLTSGSSKIRYVRLTYSASLTDYFVAGYCLAHSNNACRVNFSNISINDIAMEFFSIGCNHQLPETGMSSGILVALFNGGSITADGVKHFLTIPDSMLRIIQHLDLSENMLDGAACEALAKGVEKMSRLVKLDLSNNSFIECGGIVELMSCLHSSKLKELNIDGLSNSANRVNKQRTGPGTISKDGIDCGSDSGFGSTGDSHSTSGDSYCSSNPDSDFQSAITPSAADSKTNTSILDNISECDDSSIGCPDTERQIGSDADLEMYRRSPNISDNSSESGDSCIGNDESEHQATNTGISNPDFESLARYICSTTSLQRLKIGGNDISVESIDTLCEALSAKGSMKLLDMSFCHFATSHCHHIGKLLAQCKIEELYLRSCNITSDGVGEVVSRLNNNHTLKRLDLNNNKIRSEGVAFVATMLKENHSLNRLDLADCSIGSRGGVELGAALERNTTLRMLWLSGNALGDDGVKGLCVGLEKNSSLQELRLHADKSLQKEGVLLLPKRLENNRHLKKLSLSGKYKRDISSPLKSGCIVEWCV